MTSRPDRSTSSLALWILAVVATLFFLREAAALLIPIVLAALFAYALDPIVAWLARRQLPRWAAASLVMLAILAGTGSCGYAVKDQLSFALEELPIAARRIREVLLQTSGPAASIQQAAAELEGGATAAGASGRAAPEPAPSPGGGPSPGTLTFLQWGVGSVFTLAGHLTVIVFLVFFLLLSGPFLRDRLLEIAGPDTHRRRTAAGIIDEINGQVQSFLFVQVVTAAVVTVATGGVLVWMGVPNAWLWGALAGVFNSIPYFGPVLVSGGLFAIGLIQGGGLSQALQMAGAALAITSLEGWLLTPALLGKAERMNVIAVFLGLLLWTWLWGAWGTVLAVPMLAVVKAIADRVEPLKPFSRLLAS
jgi:predicted PurR-regulated permease PerM